MLKAVRVQNFRCFARASLDDLDDLVVLIGENDAGKSSLLEAIELGVGARKPRAGDFRRYAEGDERGNDPLTIEIDMTLMEGNNLPLHLTRDRKGKELRFRRRIMRGLESVYEVFGSPYKEPAFNEFARADAPDQKRALESVGVVPESNKAKRQEQYERLVQEGRLPWSSGWVPVTQKDLREQLPSLKRVSASDYDDPMSAVHAIVSERVRAKLVELEEADAGVFASADQVARVAIDDAIQSIRPCLKSVFPGLIEVGAEAVVDFRRPRVDANLEIDFGGGLKPLAEMGQGTRRRTWMALQYNAENGGDGRQVLRMYDEPDANLHYEAQRSLYRAIREMCASEGVQLLLCTHAVTLIDSVSPSQIRLIRGGEADGHRVESLKGRGVESSALEEIAEVGNQLGLGNMVLLYERAFLVVEGATEEGAFPALYRLVYGRSHEDDGVRIVNLETCGAWRSVVKVLLKGRAGITVMLLDQDCVEAGSSAKLTSSNLREIGVEEDHVFLVGAKEFEDAFPDGAWLRVLEKFPRKDGKPWSRDHMQAIRSVSKFSDEVVSWIRRDAEPICRSQATKPELGRMLADTCSKEEVPAVLIQTMEKLRSLAGCS